MALWDSTKGGDGVLHTVLQADVYTEKLAVSHHVTPCHGDPEEQRWATGRGLNTG